MSDVSREQYYHCTNGRCSHIFVAMISIVRTVGDSLLPKEKQSGWPFNYAITRSKKLQNAPCDELQLSLIETGPPSG